MLTEHNRLDHNNFGQIVTNCIKLKNSNSLLRLAQQGAVLLRLYCTEVFCSSAAVSPGTCWYDSEICLAMKLMAGSLDAVWKLFMEPTEL